MVDPNPIFSAVLWLIEIATASIILVSEWEKRSQTKRQHTDTNHMSATVHEDHNLRGVPKDEQETQQQQSTPM